MRVVEIEMVSPSKCQVYFNMTSFYYQNLITFSNFLSFRDVLDNTMSFTVILPYYCLKELAMIFAVLPQEDIVKESFYYKMLKVARSKPG